MERDRVAREKASLEVTFRRALILAFAAQIACGTSAAIEMSDAATDPAGTDSGGAPQMGRGDGGRDASADAKCDEILYTPTPPDTCGDYVRLPCGLPKGVAVRANCYLNLIDCATICPDIHFNCHATDDQCPDGGSVIVPDEAGAVTIDCSTCLNGAGRVPAGLAQASFPALRSAIGAYFSRAAHLEAASVHAFRALHAELTHLGAPADLLDATRAAERDEVRHTRVVGALARRFGGRYVKPSVKAPAARSREAIALDNAVEGCVRETYGALLVAWQASRAVDSDVRTTLEAIAEDELRHAALSWAVMRFLNEQLDEAAQARVAEACALAIGELSGTSTRPHEVAVALGLPAAHENAALVDELSRSLFSHAA